jgi:hypothetical protein
MSTAAQSLLSPPEPNPRLIAGGILQRKCACGTHQPGGGKCPSCADREGIHQRRADPSGSAESPGSAAAGGVAAGGRDFSGLPAGNAGPARPGRPLEPSVAARYRPGLGPLVDRVRIHDGAEGAALAAREGAIAVTSAANIYFAANAYRPHSAGGRNLLAHELAHVWQQHRSDGPPSGYQSRVGDKFEQEADRIAASEAFSRPDRLEAVSSGTRQRRTAAEQIATELRNAVEGWGTDEQAIFNALAGRTPSQIAEIEAAYLALSGGETLESRLRDELSGDDLSRALSLLRGESAATEAARRIWNAVEGLGTDEEAIYAAVAGRTDEQWRAIQDAYRQMANEPLVPRLQDELTAGEWAHLQTLLPGAAGGAVTTEDRATVAANQIQRAVEGLGTDEEAIYSALTGRTQAEIQEIGRRFRLLTGEDMEARLRDELTDSEYGRVQLLLHPQTTVDRVATELRNAMQGLGTDESAIMAILTGRPAAELPNIRAAYQRLYGEALTDRLRDELSGADLDQALELLGAGRLGPGLNGPGLLEPADEIHVAVSGLGTDEERLFAVLREISVSRATVAATIDRYAAKGYGDMLDDIRGDLSGRDLERAMELLHGATPSASCSDEQRSTGLEAISTAVSHSQNAVARIDKDISEMRLSNAVEGALARNFNPGGARNAVNLALAAGVRPILDRARGDLLMTGGVTCATPNPDPCAGPDPCVPNPDCSQGSTSAWTCGGPGTVVRLCPALFSCARDPATTMLHEFVHHQGVGDHFYSWEGGFATLTPSGDHSATDSLDNADSFAYFAKQLS